MFEHPLRVGSLRHLALRVVSLEACVVFYTECVGMQVEWQPDKDNVYLTTGTDNLALHRVNEAVFEPNQHLDHFGFILEAPEAVDAWYEALLTKQVKILAPPKMHRDGARSFYCQDPDGNAIQFMYHPPLAGPL